MDWILAGAGLLGLGGVGYVALMIFMPTIAAVVGQFVIGFANSRVGLAVIIGGACLFGGDAYRGTIDRAACNARVATIQKQIDAAAAKWRIAKANKDADVSSVIDQVVANATADINAHADELQRQLDDAKSAPHPGDCKLSPADVGGVRH